MAYKVLTDGNGSKLIRVVGLGNYMPLSEFQRVEAERDAHAVNTALIAKLNEYCQANNIGEVGASVTESVIKHVGALRVASALNTAEDLLKIIQPFFDAMYGSLRLDRDEELKYDAMVCNVNQYVEQLRVKGAI